MRIASWVNRLSLREAKGNGQAAHRSNGLSGANTPREFFDQYLLPCVLSPRQRSPRTILDYHTTLRYWSECCGEIALREISDEHCAAFVCWLAEHSGIESPNTIRRHCRNMQMLLDRAGPQLPGRRRGKSLIPAVPTLEQPPARRRIRDDAFTPDEVRAWLSVCHLATQPLDVPGVIPSRWWSSLILFLANTGQRIGAALGVEWEMLTGEWVILPARILKGSDDRRIYLNQAARQAVEDVRSEPRSLVWPWPLTEAVLHRHRRKLLAAAGIPPARHFGFHGLRRMVASMIWERDPEAAQRTLGHTRMAVTAAHYVGPTAGDRRQRELLDGLGQLI